LVGQYSRASSSHRRITIGWRWPRGQPADSASCGPKVDVDALPSDLITALKNGRVNLNEPATTLAVVRQIVALAINGFLSTWRNLFGLEWQAGSSPRERCSQRMSTVPRQGFKKKSLVLRRIALESTPPPHNDGAARRVSERIESCFHV